MRISFLKNAAAVISLLAVLAVPFGTRAGLNDIFKGWVWTPNAGWISLNSSNNNGAINYGVTSDANRNVYGWAWSDNLGWICFGSTCPGTAPDGASSWAEIDTLPDPQIHGWARLYSLYVLNPGGSEGWVSLNCASTGTHPARNVCATSNYSVYIETSSGLLRGYGWNCNTSDGSSCTQDKYVGGMGWIRFDASYTPPPGVPPGSFGGVPWVQVLYGDLYSKGSVSTPSPFTEQFTQVNAYYCIDTGIGSTVQHFAQGENCATGSVQTNINIPKSSSKYSNTLGRIKLRGYNDQLTPLDLTGLAAGKYGPWQQVSDLNAIPAVLSGKIYDTVNYGNWTLDARTVNNGYGTGATANGAGLIVVRGNLTITGDIAYQSGTITKLQHLASLGILVLDDGSGTMGNVTITTSDVSPTQTLSMNLFAEGKVSTGSTGDPTTDVPLSINGVVVAKQFNFQRVFPGTSTTPSEKITYDGRIVANTPPGMNDFVASLPAISF
jgi:hypothetical protein